MTQIIWEVSDGDLVPKVKDRPDVQIAWAPQAGSQEAFITCPIFEALLEGPRGGGKRISDATPIPTSNGWKTVGNVTLDDQLVAPDGTYTSIDGIFKHAAGTLYRVEFDDGVAVDTDGEHRWRVYDGKNMRWSVKTTAQLLKLRNPQYIPLMSAPAPGAKWTGPDPYTLGLILGDGTLTGKYVTVYGHADDEEEKDHLRSQGFTVKQYRPNCFQAYHTTSQGGEKWRDVLGRCVGDLKRVPQELLDADPTTRLSLLQGLMDADGSVDKTGTRCSFSSVSPHLAYAVQELTRSLGGKSTIQEKPFSSDGLSQRQSYFHVNVMTCGKFVPFRLSRKVDRVRNKTLGMRRRIVSIKQIEDAPATCFSVAHHSHLFVVGRGYVITHNTDVLIMDFLQDVGKGFGREWRGVLFRQTFPQLKDVINKCLELIPRIFPDAKYNKVEHTWAFKDGEELILSFAKVESDYWNFHGHNYTWLGWEELTTWADPAVYKKMFSVVRSKNHRIRKRVRSTTNPYGSGHNWVKHRFRLPIRSGDVVGDIIHTEGEPDRVAIHSTLEENRVLLNADPDYTNNIRAAARNKAELAAWIDGSWDIVAGGMFDDIWTPEVHVVQATKIPRTWELDRSFDWGSSRPFSVGWWAKSDGSDLLLPNKKRLRTLRGDMFRVAEWYGYTGEPNEGLRMTAKEIARGIKEREVNWWPGRTVRAGPADSSIFDVQDGNSVAINMTSQGVRWQKAHKGPGSRKNGWERMREMLAGALPNGDGTPREEIGLFVFDTCDQFRRTVPVLPRSQKDLDDVDTDAEDHVADECRYRLYKGGGRLHRKKAPRGH